MIKRRRIVIQVKEVTQKGLHSRRTDRVMRSYVRKTPVRCTDRQETAYIGVSCIISIEVSTREIFIQYTLS